MKPTGESRVFRDGDRRVGTLRVITWDSLTIDWTDGGRATVAFASVSRLGASRGRQHFVVRGLLIGGVAGAGTGALIGAASYDSSPCATPAASSTTAEASMQPSARYSAAGRDCLWGERPGPSADVRFGIG